MPIAHIFSFLTYPKKGLPDEAPPTGASIALADSKLCKMLGSIFDASGTDCSIPIMFASEGGAQANAVRSELIELFRAPTMASAAPLANRLQQATMKSSGMGLLFICVGPAGPAGLPNRAVISRFPADEGIVAERSENELNVSFVEQVFLKNSHSYKAATYLSEGRRNELWKGHAVDRQINSGSKSIANYWVVEFLKSDFTTTAATGTRRLALAFKAAIDSTSDPAVKTELASAVNLAGNLRDNAMSINGFCAALNLSDNTSSAVMAAVVPARLAEETFRFDKTEFAKHIAYKQVELDNGAVLSAPLEKFDECFETSQAADAPEDALTYATTGKVVDERFKRSK